MSSPDDPKALSTIGFVAAYAGLTAVLIAALLAAFWSLNRTEGARRAASRAIDITAEQAALAVEITGLLPSEEAADLRRLRIAAATFARQHEALLDGDDAIGLPSRRSVLTQIWHDEPSRLDQNARLIIDAAARVAETGQTPDAAALARAAAARDGVEAGMAAAAAAIRVESAAAVSFARSLGRGALTAALGAALTCWLVVFLPLVRRARSLDRERRRASRELERLNLHDALTDLPNRAAFTAWLRRAASGAEPFCLFHFQTLDLSDMNRIHGEARVDAALTRMARILDHSAHVGDFVARAGAGDFRMIQTSAMSRDEMEARCRDLVRALSGAMELDGKRLAAPMIGAAVPGAPGETAETLTRQAEIALADARREGAGAVSVFSAELGRVFEARDRMAEDIRRAFDEDQFEPFFQPQVSVRTGALLGFEALARWRHPRQGLLTPSSFLYNVTDLGYGDALDERMMEKSLDELALWRKAGLTSPRLSVNFASDQLSDSFMIDKIRWAVEQRDLTPEAVCIEILETVLMEEDGQQTSQNIEALARSGFGLDLDDFGTGHASIAALRRFAVDRIKIDSSFVRGIETSADQTNVVAAMIEMAHSLNVQVVAEGVETEGELQALRNLNCDVLQGFLVSRPLPSSEALQWALAYAPPALGRAG